MLANGGSLKPHIVAALRKAWDMPEPNAAETAIADRIVDVRARLDSGH